VVRGLSDVAGDDATSDAAVALRQIGSSPAATRILGELDTRSVEASGEELEDIVAAVKLLVAHSPGAALELLDASQSRKMRRVLLDALPLAGKALLPLLRSRTRASSWFIVRNAVLLLGKSGGSARDLEPASRHPNEKVRLEVARAIRALPPEEAAMDIVVQFLTDASPEVGQAARALLRGDLLGAFAIAVLERLAGDERTDDDLRRRVIRALGASAQDTAAAALFKLLQPQGLLDLGSSAPFREAAAAALCASPAPRAPEFFKQGLTSSSRRVRKACERAAGRG
jgi:hypothetical protein